ncbi:hypothetical protein AXF42_Ash006245 [Apostasia shenzhenica]|uniref:CCT domain-containing protein n=1 Tax=Apostasia shenzhenica TaxID=1088818 RepID=A0A2I0AYI8_9ASPA|nr:hypothetical protein AXF42_Ash006245 [Apostasia shenzhenica]
MGFSGGRYITDSYSPEYSTARRSTALPRADFPPQSLLKSVYDCEHGLMYGGPAAGMGHPPCAVSGDVAAAAAIAEMEYNNDHGFESAMPHRFDSNDLQILGYRGQQQERVNSAVGLCSRITPEERKEKIHRKTLADSRPRVRGRFAKNEEFGETERRLNTSNHGYDDEEQEVVVKEDDQLGPTNIPANIIEVNPFKYYYTLDTWI